MITVGIDIVKISRIEKLIEKYQDRFWIRHLGTEREWKEAKTRKNIAETLAGKFATKEAYIKAVSHIIKGPSFQDVEILHDTEGRPFIVTNRIDLDSKQFQISISHEKEYAVSVVLFIESQTVF